MRGQGLMPQALRYATVGAVVWASDYMAYALLLTGFPAALLAANAGGKAVGSAIGFVLHRQVTFSWDQRDHPARQAVAYLAVFLGNLAASSVLLWLLVDRLGANPYWARLAVDALVIASAFLLSRAWVYRPR